MCSSVSALQTLNLTLWILSCRRHLGTRWQDVLLLVQIYSLPQKSVVNQTNSAVPESQKKNLHNPAQLEKRWSHAATHCSEDNQDWTSHKICLIAWIYLSNFQNKDAPVSERVAFRQYYIFVANKSSRQLRWTRKFMYQPSSFPLVLSHSSWIAFPCELSHSSPWGKLFPLWKY